MWLYKYVWILFLFFAETVIQGSTSPVKTVDEEVSYQHTPLRPVLKRAKLRLIHASMPSRSIIHRDAIFEPTKYRSDKCIRIKIKNCRTQVTRPNTVHNQMNYSFSSRGGTVVASGLLNRFKYKFNKPSKDFPIFGAIML